MSVDIVQAICHAYSDKALALLGRFVRLEDIHQVLRLNQWSSVPRDTVDQSIQSFIREGLLLPADLPGKIDYKLKTSDIKTLLRKLGLAVSGRKDVLIERLVMADPNGAGNCVAGTEIYLCTDLGRAVVKCHHAEETAQQMCLEQGVMDALRMRDFRAAVELVYEGGFRGVMRVSLGEETTSDRHYREQDSDVLSIIFNRAPAVLKHLDDRTLDHLRVAAGMLNLFSRGSFLVALFPPDFTTGLPIENEWAARLLITHAYYRQGLEHFKELGVKRVQMRGANDSHVCEACKEIQSRAFRLGDGPELPHLKCTSTLGCRCSMHPVRQ